MGNPASPLSLFHLSRDIDDPTPGAAFWQHDAENARMNRRFNVQDKLGQIRLYAHENGWMFGRSCVQCFPNRLSRHCLPRWRDSILKIQNDAI
jgi:hypothetical protein